RPLHPQAGDHPVRMHHAPPSPAFLLSRRRRITIERPSSCSREDECSAVGKLSSEGSEVDSTTSQSSAGSARGRENSTSPVAPLKRRRNVSSTTRSPRSSHSSIASPPSRIPNDGIPLCH